MEPARVIELSRVIELVEITRAGPGRPFKRAPLRWGGPLGPKPGGLPVRVAAIRDRTPQGVHSQRAMEPARVIELSRVIELVEITRAGLGRPFKRAPLPLGR